MNSPDLHQAKNIFDPFDKLVWMLILLSGVLMVATMYLLLLPSSDQFSPTELAWFIYGALLKQGSTLSPSADVARILFGTWWVFITIVTAFYTAQLTVVLASSSRLLPVNNLQEINQDSAATWVAVGGGALETILRSWPEFVASQADLRSGKGRFVSSEEEAVSALHSGSSLYYLTDSWSATNLIFTEYRTTPASQDCGYTYTDKFTFAPIPVGFIFPQNSSLREKFNSVLEQLIQSGLLEKEFATLEDEVELVSLCSSGAQDKTLTFPDVQFTLLITLIGGLLGLVFFTGENIAIALKRLVLLIYQARDRDRRGQRKVGALNCKA